MSLARATAGLPRQLAGPAPRWRCDRSPLAGPRPPRPAAHLASSPGPPGLGLFWGGPVRHVLAEAPPRPEARAGPSRCGRDGEVGPAQAAGDAEAALRCADRHSHAIRAAGEAPGAAPGAAGEGRALQAGPRLGEQAWAGQSPPRPGSQEPERGVCAARLARAPAAHAPRRGAVWCSGALTALGVQPPPRASGSSDSDECSVL